MGFIARAIGRKIEKTLEEAASTPEGRAAIERHRGIVTVTDLATEVACSGLDDESARARLGDQLPVDDDLARGAIEHLGALRTTYLNDRAYRLLTAAVDGTSVRPIDPAVRDQFLEEANLGRMSLSDALDRLAALDPRLRDSTRDPTKAQSERERRVSKSLTIGSGHTEMPLVGPDAETPYPIMKTQLAEDIVREYRHLAGRGSVFDRESTPFFERRKLTSSVRGYLFGKGDHRPRARN